MAAPSCSLAQCNPHPSIPCWPLFIYSLILWWWWRLSIIDYIIIIVLSPQILWPFGRENSVHGQPKRKKEKVAFF
jgi:hypothetical protein